MRDILEYCVGGTKRRVAAGTEVLHEGGRTGHLYVLIEGRLEVTKRSVRVGTADGGLLLGQVRPQGRRPMPATDWARGVAIGDGDGFGD